MNSSCKTYRQRTCRAPCYCGLPGSTGPVTSLRTPFNNLLSANLASGRHQTTNKQKTHIFTTLEAEVATFYNYSRFNVATKPSKKTNVTPPGSACRRRSAGAAFGAPSARALLPGCGRFFPFWRWYVILSFFFFFFLWVVSLFLFIFFWGGSRVVSLFVFAFLEGGVVTLLFFGLFVCVCVCVCVCGGGGGFKGKPKGQATFFLGWSSGEAQKTATLWGRFFLFPRETAIFGAPNLDFGSPPSPSARPQCPSPQTPRSPSASAPGR